MNISLPELSLVVLVGASGSGKSTFARRHFKPTEILSSDFCRGLVSDDANDQAATKDAFDILNYICRKRLATGRLTVVDATNVRVEDRKGLVELAREFHVLPVAIVLNLPARLCQERNADRSDRDFGPHVVRQQSQLLACSLRSLRREGFRGVHILHTAEEVEATTIERHPLWNNRRSEHGPFDIIGDVHGCYEELVELLTKLGYGVAKRADSPLGRHPAGRKVIFLGDLVDRGPRTPEVLQLVMSMVEADSAYCVQGNHEQKLMRKLAGRNVQITHGLGETLEQLESTTEDFKERIPDFLENLVSHYMFDDGKLVVSHAGLKEELQGRASGQVRDFCLYGETTGETDEFGLPVRYNWAADYRGKATVVYGHTPVPETEWLNRTLCIDTGCVFGGKLTALRYPDMEIVQVSAKRTYYEPVRPLLPQDEQVAPSEVRPYNDLLDIEDVIGKRIVSTRVRQNITIREENAIAALEVMSRFAADPHWLIYLPPTMAPPETCQEGQYLEHPKETFAYFCNQGVPQVVCEEKHMGSRAVIVLCRDEAVARQRFGVSGDEIGIIYTRTGRPFFSDTRMERQVLDRLRKAMDKSDLWSNLESDWICLDAELMPWSAKALELLRTQYIPTGASGRASLAAAVRNLEQASEREDDIDGLLEQFRSRQRRVERYIDAYRRYCWPVNELSDFKIAPFHLLASEGKTHTDRDHLWHMATLSKLCQADEELLLATPHRVVDVTDDDSQEEGIRWWEDLTERGGEGMVVKPLEWVVRGRRGLVQPAVKCRGREYLRIIYGPEYTDPKHLNRLRARSLSRKRSLALREFALGLEALHRFTEGEPLYRVHECVFGVLALESEPIDPRL